jgi:hypothetical protein
VPATRLRIRLRCPSYGLLSSQPIPVAACTQQAPHTRSPLRAAAIGRRRMFAASRRAASCAERPCLRPRTGALGAILVWTRCSAGGPEQAVAHVHASALAGVPWDARRHPRALQCSYGHTAAAGASHRSAVASQLGAYVACVDRVVGVEAA